MRQVLSAIMLVAANGLFLPDARTAQPLTQPSLAEIRVLNAKGEAVDRLTDGASIRLRLDMERPPDSDQVARFALDGSQASIASCSLNKGSNSCTTEPFTTLGWYWSDAGDPSPGRTITASLDGLSPMAAVPIQMGARPVVMVHGFASTWEAWTRYVGPSGYLASQDLAGFAVGDGRAPGAMRTGDFVSPADRTNTIAENAAVLSEYIEGVKKQTGADQVDVIAHSMGGLIARYYIDRVMGSRDVAQLIMLGSPMAGTDCADLPAALGLYLPATLEIRPSYVKDVFNPSIFRRRGVPFHALAGVPIVEGLEAPCTGVPTDLAVSLDSVTAIPLSSSRMPVLHTDLNLSQDVFDQFVLPLLQTPAGGFPEEPDPPTSEGSAELQSSKVFTGHVAPGEPQGLVIPIDSGVTVASFALYDTTRSLDVTVHGASGNEIALSPEANGLVVIQDPASMIYLGYGFANPKPGAWRVTLTATEATPGGGADFALAAHFVGGVRAEASVTPILPRVGEPINIRAGLASSPSEASLLEASASIRRPDGVLETIPLSLVGSQANGDWEAEKPGVYGIDVTLIGRNADGENLERTIFLAIEAQPTQGLLGRASSWIALSIILLLIGAAAIWFRSARKNRSDRPPRLAG